MRWFDRHARYRAQLSAYIDAQLSQDDTDALQSHLAACDVCRRELDELRATVMAVRDLPEADIPRSFALTPDQVARPVVAPLPSAPQLTFALRLAAPALAFALGVALVADFGDFSGGGGSGDSSRGLSIESAADQNSPPSPGAPEIAAPEPNKSNEYSGAAADADTASRLADCPPTDSGAGLGPAATGAPAPGGATIVPTPEPVPAATLQAGNLDIQDIAAACDTALAREMEAAVPTGATQQATDFRQKSVESGDGLSTLRIIEIVLAASLAAVGVGALTAAIVVRKREVR